MGHVIFGTGAVGMAVMETLVGRGEQVRMINRTGSAEVPVGVDVRGGDASDPAFARRAAAGATVVYQALNPAYTFGISATPVSESIAQTLDWYRRGRDREVGQLTKSPAS
jgi:uncharacterized protein YbjT (DUF2867 family)